jgi:hypothetical protein
MKPFIKVKFPQGKGHIYKYFSILDAGKGSVCLFNIFLDLLEYLSKITLNGL